MSDAGRAGRRILVICLQSFENQADEQCLRAWIKAKQAEGVPVTALVATQTLGIFRDLPVNIWSDGGSNGLLRLLALVRRMSWGSFSAVYDLDMSWRTRFYRFFVVPCPPWHSGLDEKSQKHKAS